MCFRIVSLKRYDLASRCACAAVLRELSSKLSCAVLAERSSGGVMNARRTGISFETASRSGVHVVCFCNGCIAINPCGVIRATANIARNRARVNGSHADPPFARICKGASTLPAFPGPGGELAANPGGDGLVDDSSSLDSQFAHSQSDSAGLNPDLRGDLDDIQFPQDVHIGPSADESDAEWVQRMSDLYSKEELQARLPGSDGMHEIKKQYKATAIPARFWQDFIRLCLNLLRVKAEDNNITEPTMEKILATHRNAKLYPKEYANAIPKEWKHLKATFESVLTEGFPKMFKCDSCEHCGSLFRNSTDKKHGVL